MTRTQPSRHPWWRSRPLRLAAMVGVGAVGVGAVVAAQRARAAVHASARQLVADGASLSHCVRDAVPSPGPLPLRLLPPEGAPLSVCAPLLDTALDHAAAHRRLRLTRATAELDTLFAELTAVRDAQALQRTAAEFESSGGVEPVIRALDRAAVAACEVARREGARTEPCGAPEPRRATPLPAARTLLELEVPGSGPLVWRAFSRGDTEATLLIALSAGERGDLRVLQTFDAGANFTAEHSALPVGEPTDVRLTGATRAVVLHGDGHATSVRVVAPGELTPVVRLPPPPPGLIRVAAGTPLLELADGSLVEVLAPTSGESGGALRYHAAGTLPRLRDLPSGLVAGGLAIHEPRVVTLRRAATEFAELDVFAVPSFSAPFAEPQRIGIPYVPSLDLTAEPENLCGISGEKLSLLLGRGVYDALIALDPSRAFPFKLGAHPLSALHTVCGGCPPSVLEHAETPLLHVPVRRTMAGFPARPARAFAAKDVLASARAGCSSGAVVLAFVVDGHVVVEATEGSGWTFGPPRIVAAPDASGAATRVEVVGFRDRLLVLWLRRGPRRTRLEALFLPATLR